ncbi:MAG: ABC transporter ATP-binding protein [Dehalococcoidia bacterium]|nr:ABC transporter ATP-binding protein [Dehalococcoidia bacterium]
MEFLLEAVSVTKRFGGFTALDELDISISDGERLGLIGPNGSGKTTFINCVSGALKNDSGAIKFQGGEISKLAAHKRIRLGIARSFQIPKPFKSMTVRENLLIPYEFGVQALKSNAAKTPDEVLSLMGLNDKSDENAGNLTQVELRKLELARAVAADPKLLISDEAMAGLSGAEVDDILEILFLLNERGITIIMIEHIMRAVMEFSDRIVVLDAGQKIADGKPKAIAQNVRVQQAYLGV